MTRLIHLAQLFLFPVAVIACGPWIPTPYVVRNDAVFFDAPQLNFIRELEEVLPADTPFEAIILQDQAPNASEALKRWLEQSGDSPDKQAIALADYQRYRKLLTNAKYHHDFPPYRSYYPQSDEPQPSEAVVIQTLRAESPPTSLPDEFQLYLQGARYYYLGDITEARKAWKKLLQLPESQRRIQSVPAAFMLGRTAWDYESGKHAYSKDSAKAYFQQVRDLALTGFDDPDGLAAASYGREAQAALKIFRFADAVELYLAQWQTGYSNAALSLQRTAAAIWEQSSQSQLEALLVNESVRALLTADLLVRYENAENQELRSRFLSALPSPKQIAVQEAGRFALLEYQQNNLSATRLWLEYASPRDALALWVRSKLLLRDGKIDEGRVLLVELLQNVTDENPDWPRIDTHHAWGELGLLMLRKEQFGEAANCFQNAGSWLDLVYVLERVMTLEELREWMLLAPETVTEERERYYTATYNLRELLGRRLMRSAQFDAALPYFSADARQQAEAYIRSMREASKADSPAAIRAQHYWQAACIMRDYGLALFATELDPDYAWNGGSFAFPDMANNRQRSGVNIASHEEERRVELSALKTDQRYHYRYRAAQLAELAAGLLPNNDENAARIYCIAGSWIKNRDPNAADRFYKQLVVRCPETKLGKIAARLHWFPPDHELLAEPFEG